MDKRLWLLLVLASTQLPAIAQTVSNGLVQVSPIGEKGRYIGFTLKPAGRREPLATIRFR